MTKNINKKLKTSRNKLHALTFERVVSNFTKNVNRFFRKNDTDFEPTNSTEKQAQELFKKKKNVGKYVPKSVYSGAGTKSVIDKCAIEDVAVSQIIVKKDIKKNISKKSVPVSKKKTIRKPMINEKS